MSTAQATVEQAQGWFQALAGKRGWGEPVQRGIERAARRTGLSYSQGKRLWYGDLASIPAHIFLTIQQRYSEFEATQNRKTAIAFETARLAQGRANDAADDYGMDIEGTGGKGRKAISASGTADATGGEVPTKRG